MRPLNRVSMVEHQAEKKRPTRVGWAADRRRPLIGRASSPPHIDSVARGTSSSQVVVFDAVGAVGRIQDAVVVGVAEGLTIELSV